MTNPTAPTTSSAVRWYQLTVEETASQLDVDPAVGLSTPEVARRREQYGPNVLAAKEAESPLQAFLRQYQDLMQIILVGAAIVNQVVTGELGTTLVLLGLTIFNAVLGLRQEAKAEASLAALQKMLKDIARVPPRRRGRRDRRRRAGARRRRAVRGRQPGAGRRSTDRRGDARDRGGSAHR